MNESAKNELGFGQLVLFIFTLYLGVVPILFPQIIWMSVTAMVLGVLELFAHLGAIRMNSSRRYSPGLVTAMLLPIISIYGFYYLISNHLMQPIWWLYAVLNLFIPLICAQFIAVKSMRQNYGEFLRKSSSAMFKKK
jgi:hypothetical protein